jgi:prepilin-type N-terminal cleavage/methylation domain-containing protein
MIKVSENKQGGFTIIEVIAALVLAAVVAAGLIQYLGTSLGKSSISTQRLRQAYELQEVMENITVDYREDTSLSALSALSVAIGGVGPQGPNDYGQYYMVVVNTFIKFEGSPPTSESTDPPDQDNLLKVTIKNDSGILTTLFPSQ